MILDFNLNEQFFKKNQKEDFIQFLQRKFD